MSCPNLCRSRLLESEAMASAVSRRSLMSASRMGRMSIEPATESILELAKQDLNTQMKKAKVQYKYGIPDYSYTYNLNLESSFSLEKNHAWSTRDARESCVGYSRNTSRVGYPRNTSHVERSASNRRESRAREKFKPANRFTKGPAPRCHGKAFKRESFLTRGINKVKKTLFGLKVVPRRLTVKQNQAKKCLNAYGFGLERKPGTISRAPSTNLATASRPPARATASKIPIPVNNVSRRKHLQSFVMNDSGYASTSRDHDGSIRDSVDCADNRSSDSHSNPSRSSKTGSEYNMTVPSGRILCRTYQNLPDATSSFGKSHGGMRSGGMRDEDSSTRRTEAMKYPSRHSTGMLELSYPREIEKQLIPDSDDVKSCEGPRDSWEIFDGKSAVLREKRSLANSGRSRKKQNIPPNLIGLNSKTSRECTSIGVDSPMSSHGSWEGYECDEAMSDHVRPLSSNMRPTSEILRPISENVCLQSENVRPSSENLRVTPSHRLPRSENVRPMSLELDEKATSLSARRSRLEKDLDNLMQTMEKVLGSPVSPSHELDSGTWPRKMSRGKPKGTMVMFDKPVFEAVI